MQDRVNKNSKRETQALAFFFFFIFLKLPTLFQDFQKLSDVLITSLIFLEMEREHLIIIKVLISHNPSSSLHKICKLNEQHASQ